MPNNAVMLLSSIILIELVVDRLMRRQQEKKAQSSFVVSQHYLASLWGDKIIKISPGLEAPCQGGWGNRLLKSRCLDKRGLRAFLQPPDECLTWFYDLPGLQLLLTNVSCPLILPSSPPFTSFSPLFSPEDVYQEFHETCRSVTFIVLVISHQR